MKGLGYGINKPVHALIPHRGLLDQLLLKSRPIELNGLIHDEKGSLNAQLVEQPCGVFDGTASVDMGAGSQFALGTTFTITGRFKTPSGGAVEALVTSYAGVDLWITLTADNTIRFAYRDAAANANDHSATFTVRDDNVHSFVCKRNGDVNSINIDDGTPATKTISGVGATTLDTNIIIGALTGGTQKFSGSIFDIRIHGRVLTSAEETKVSNGEIIGDELMIVPDPSTSYDVSGNENHGTPTNVTKGTQDVFAYFQKYGFNQYLKCTSAGVAAIQSSQAYGINEFNLYKGADGNASVFAIISERGTERYNAYQVTFSNNETIKLQRRPLNGVGVSLFETAASYISINTLYRIREVRNKTTDQYVTGPVGTFAVYIKGGAFGWDDWILVVANTGSNPVTDNTYTTSNGCVLENDAGDLFGNAKFTDENGNVRWLPNDINKWITDGGAVYENHIVPADQGDLTKDVLGNALHYLPSGILPLGAIDFNPEDGSDTELDLFNRDNVIGQAKEFWRTEIKDLASYDAGETYQHDADEFCLDYLMTYGTETLIKRLFLKKHKTEEDLVAISNILNYSGGLSTAQKARVLNFLKDPTKTDYAAWDVYKASSVVCAFNFRDRFSLFEHDGYLAELGWEDNVYTSDFTAGVDSFNNYNLHTLTDADGVPVADPLDDVLKCTANGVDIHHYTRKYNATAFDKMHLTCKVYIPSTNTNVDRARFTDGALSIANVTTTDEWVDVDVRFDPGVGRFYIYMYLMKGALYEYVGANSADDDIVYIKDLVIDNIGDTIAKVMDVGSGNGSDTYYNALQSDLSKQPVRTDEGLEFDNNLFQRLELADTALDNFPGTQPFEIEAKFKPYAVDHYQCLLEKLQTSNIRWNFGMNADGSLAFYCQNTGASIDDVVKTNTGVITINEWNTVKIVTDRTVNGTKIYINDIEQTLATNDMSNDDYSNTGDVLIGHLSRAGDVATSHFEGIIEYIKIRNSIT